MQTSVLGERPIESENSALADRRSRAACMARFGTWLKTRGISQTEAAGHLGLHRGHLSNLIGGKHVPDERFCQTVLHYMSTGGPESSPRADVRGGTDSSPTGRLTLLPPLPVEVPSTPAPVNYRRALCAEEVTTVGSIVRAVVDTRPGMTAEELVAVTKAVVEGFR